ncbi:maleylpyruvate isomerase N-terminal domain-containing protein [Brachybacterium paraconglomeratum]|uniref:maleylpyruvate isomerase N-terminal domain-containing protein n=1 Tax=Brachybacterium paraconglomeratum TaxID=173362 RepID=UPI0021A27616|nr:maleylpyruvate isomerase N-terminal domain-containing protein [Brachybacterium paraconglomeratum]MCT1908826.1 maleylpyruvate isomerase N-terminal domain-containing protein [Brachybacterium paraconglomeratum]
MELFTTTWAALRRAVHELPEHAFSLPSGCRGWLVRDLVGHLVIDAQDVLITLATPAETAPTADALSCWTPTPAPPDGTDPHDALTVRLAAAYEDPGLLRKHLEDLGGAAERAALLAEPDLPVATQGMSLTVRDFLHAYVLEWTLHHLDLLAHLGPEDAPAPPPVEGLAEARDMVERRLRVRLPAGWADADALRRATGRLPITDAQRAELEELGPRGEMLPLSFG